MMFMFFALTIGFALVPGSSHAAAFISSPSSGKAFKTRPSLGVLIEALPDSRQSVTVNAPTTHSTIEKMLPSFEKCRVSDCGVLIS